MNVKNCFLEKFWNLMKMKYKLLLTKAKNHLPAQLLTPAIKFTRSTAALSNETAKAVFLAKNVTCKHRKK